MISCPFYFLPFNLIVLVSGSCGAICKEPFAQMMDTSIDWRWLWWCWFIVLAHTSILKVFGSVIFPKLPSARWWTHVPAGHFLRGYELPFSRDFSRDPSINQSINQSTPLFWVEALTCLPWCLCNLYDRPCLHSREIYREESHVFQCRRFGMVYTHCSHMQSL